MHVERAYNLLLVVMPICHAALTSASYVMGHHELDHHSAVSVHTHVATAYFFASLSRP